MNNFILHTVQLSIKQLLSGYKFDMEFGSEAIDAEFTITKESINILIDGPIDGIQYTHIFKFISLGEPYDHSFIYIKTFKINNVDKYLMYKLGDVI